MYQCLASDFPKLEKRIQSTIRLIEKYGFSAEYKVINKEVKEVPFRKADRLTSTVVTLGNVLVEVVNYEFTMPDFKVGNYIPVAVIEHDVVVDSDSALNMVHLINDFENAPKEWWTIKGHCDDCNDSYNRKKTIMLYDEENKSFRQIGTTCLKKYLGISCYNVINNFMSINEILEEEVVVYGDSLPKENNYVNTERFLGLVIDEINKNGYINKGVTAHRAFEAIKEGNKYPTEQAAEYAKEIINFFKNVDTENKNFNYFYMDIRSAVLTTYIYESNLIGYAPLAYKKYLRILEEEKSQQIRKQNSEYVGNVGDKITAQVEVIKCVGFETAYGYSYMNIFEEENTNNVFTWTTTTKAYNVGTKMKIMGSVKAHKEYEGTKQTALTRVKEIA